MDDRRVPSLSNAEIKVIAKKLREYFGVANDTRVDVISCASRPKIWTVDGELPLRFEVVPDKELGKDDALTSRTERGVLIRSKRSVADRARWGEGRARNTIAHELGHAVMHDRVEMPRVTLGNVTPKWIRPFESSEHQVKVFAPAFLINDTIAATLHGAEDISVKFGTSLESASIYCSELELGRNRAEGVARVRRLADEFRATATPEANSSKLPMVICPVCGAPTLFAVGCKFLCQTCDTVLDRFQDGDPL